MLPWRVAGCNSYHSHGFCLSHIDVKSTVFTELSYVCCFLEPSLGFMHQSLIIYIVYTLQSTSITLASGLAFFLALRLGITGLVSAHPLCRGEPLDTTLNASTIAVHQLIPTLNMGRPSMSPWGALTVPVLTSNQPESSPLNLIALVRSSSKEGLHNSYVLNS